ncbi:SH3 domain-containing protein [Sphingobium aquiterrae]|uniref:SH3 domain-containing protein n=1 Tax=Sphingobium aquiterrae TaxID=2038656 RepID=UPI003AFA55CB
MNTLFRLPLAALFLALMLMVVGDRALAEGRPVPYWASIAADEARMRVGPSLDYPSNWVYRRRDLPVKVVQVHGNWRKVEDSAGAQGWMHVRLLSDRTTAIVVGDIAMMRESADDRAPVAFRVEPGVVGRISGCSAGWCSFDIGGRKGKVRAESLWGATR